MSIFLLSLALTVTASGAMTDAAVQAISIPVLNRDAHDRQTRGLMAAPESAPGPVLVPQPGKTISLPGATVRPQEADQTDSPRRGSGTPQ